MQYPKYPILLFLLIISSCTSCPEDPLYTFDIQIQLEPVKDEYSLGDTLKIFVEVEDNSILDQNTNERIYFESAAFPFRCMISEKDYGHYSETGYFKFNTADIVDTNLTIIHREYGSEILFNYGCPNGTDSLKFNFEVVLDKPGLFLISPRVYDDEVFLYENKCDSLLNEGYIYDAWYYAEINYKFDLYDHQLETFYATYKGNWGLATENNAIEKRIYWIQVKE